MSVVREQTYLVMLALAEQPLHGYAVIAAVRDLSDGVVRLGPGTLYGAIDRLVSEGMVTMTAEELVDGRHRRYYALTGPGRTHVIEETHRREQLSRRAARVLALPRPSGAVTA